MGLPDCGPRVDDHEGDGGGSRGGTPGIEARGVVVEGDQGAGHQGLEHVVVVVVEGDQGAGHRKIDITWW